MTRSIRNLMFISITALVVSAGAYAAFIRPGPLSPAVFEIRAIDTQGHPVAGAEVWMENQSLGMTDSFGIWRRNLNLPEGTEARFNFRKKFSGFKGNAPAREYSAMKSFHVGKSGHKRAENHRGSVKMEPVRL